MLRKLLARPVAAPFFFIFGLVLSQIGYAYLHRGSFQFKPKDGAIQIISPASEPNMYWTTTLTLLSLGIVCLVVSVCAAFCLFNASRSASRDVSPFRRYGMFAFSMLIIVAALIIALTSDHAYI